MPLRSTHLRTRACTFCGMEYCRRIVIGCQRGGQTPPASHRSKGRRSIRQKEHVGCKSMGNNDDACFVIQTSIIGPNLARPGKDTPLRPWHCGAAASSSALGPLRSLGSPGVATASQLRVRILGFPAASLTTSPARTQADGEEVISKRRRRYLKSRWYFPPYFCSWSPNTGRPTPYLAIVPCFGSTDSLFPRSGSEVPSTWRHWSCQSYPCLGGTWGVVGESSSASLITATLCHPLPLLHQCSQTARCARRYGLVQPLRFSGPRSVRRLLAHPMTIPPLLAILATL